jgi:hypothetical protein
VENPFEHFDDFFYEMGVENVEEVFNSYFLYDGSRPGFSLHVKRDPANVIAKISKYFNFDYYEAGAHILVTIKNRSLKLDPKNYTSEELGKFLGYPCAEDFVSKREYVLAISVIDSTTGATYELIGMICGQKESDSMKLFTDKIKRTINKINKHSKKHNFKMFSYSRYILKPHEIVQAVNENKLNRTIKNEIVNWIYNYDPQRLFDPSRRELLKALVADMAEYQKESDEQIK